MVEFSFSGLQKLYKWLEQQSRYESGMSQEGRVFHSEAPLTVPILEEDTKSHIHSEARRLLSCTHTVWTFPCEDAAVVWYSMLIAVLVRSPGRTPSSGGAELCVMVAAREHLISTSKSKSCETASTAPYIASWKPQRRTLCRFIQFGWK